VTPSLDFLSTRCEALDQILGGGLSRGEVSLVYGEPGVGKTSLALQCAVTCAKKDYKTIFIDSDNTFSIPRFTQIAGSPLDTISPFVFIFKPHTFEEQSLLIENLENYNLHTIALIVVDTITTLYRISFDSVGDVVSLNMKLNWQLAYLNELAKSYHTSILLTSQVRSVIDSELSETKVEPVASRVLNFWAQKIIHFQSTSETVQKKAVLKKGFTGNKNTCFFILSKAGLLSTSQN